MAKKKPPKYHVVPNPDGGWDAKKGGAKRSSGHFQTKQEAVDRARDLSRKNGGELRIHGKDGKMQRGASHGNDPFPPRDRK
jgi:hypothetical protein